ncbi:MAG: hypothetical protein JWQ40_3961 [Segetibacter sp.]|jgi:hypothetical protein|nr:hypothetical protein [Segetibacter sp.]
MKKLFIAALLALSVVTGAFAADTKKVSKIVLNNFSSEFKDAGNIAWAAVGEYAKATFTLNNQRMEAFYNWNGEMIGTSKAITLEQLPTNAKRNFARKFDGYAVKEAIRFEGTEEAAYYISAENEKEALIIKIADSSDVSIFSRTKK